MSDISWSSISRILKKTGAERISNESVEELRRVIEDIASEIARDAITLSKHAGRKTIKGEDIKLASKRFK